MSFMAEMEKKAKRRKLTSMSDDDQSTEKTKGIPWPRLE
jgi:hypothetical protein